jgi:ABC-type transport system substrate-binding protein
LLGTLVGCLGQLYDAQFMLEHGGPGTPTTINGYFNLNPMPGTGPYTLGQVSNQEFIGFTQNPTYWGRNLTASEIAANPYLDPGQVKNILVQIKPDTTARYLDLADGAAQIANIGPQSWNLILASPDKYAYVTLPPTAGLIAGETLNVRLYPTNITDVRLAIVHAINMTDLISKIYGQAAQFVGPEYPAWKQFYDLGNYTPYSYNLTLAAQYLAQAGFPNGKGLPPVSYVVAACTSLDCAGRAEIIQTDLAQIGINVNINVLSGQNWCTQAGCEPYSWVINNTASLGNIEDVGGNTNSPTFLSPADYWTEFVSNNSAFGNTAAYATTASNGCDASFFNGSSVATVQSICGQAQAEIYAQAPLFGWVVPTYNLGASAVSWDKSVVKSLYYDSNFGGTGNLFVLNTVVFS